MLLALAMLATVQPAAPATTANPEKKICKSVAKTGTVMRKRECHTRSEWALIAERNRESADRVMQERDSSF